MAYLRLRLEKVTDEDSKRLFLRTIEQTNAACNYASGWAWQHQEFRQARIQKALYRDVRERFGLPAQMAVLGFAKVADAYRRGRSRQIAFPATGSISYDRRMWTWYPEWRDLGGVNILTLAGRLYVSYENDERIRKLYTWHTGEADLGVMDGRLVFGVVCWVEKPMPGLMV